MNRRELFQSALAATALGSLNVSAETKKNSTVPQNMLFSVEDIEKRRNPLIVTENPLGMSPRAARALTRPFKNIERYGMYDIATEELKKELELSHKIPSSHFTLAAGSTQVLIQLLNYCKMHNRSLVIPAQDFIFMRFWAHRMGVALKEVPLTNEGTVDLSMLRKTASADDVVYFTNPHCIFGSITPKKALEDLLSSIPKTQFVMIDECYIEFFDGLRPSFSAVDLVPKWPQLLVARTFSKAYGLASFRTGYLVASEDSRDKIFPLETMKPPGVFEASALSLFLAKEALKDRNHIGETQKCIHNFRKILSEDLKALGLQNVEPIEVPWITFKFSEMKKFEFFRDLGLYVEAIDKSTYFAKVSLTDLKATRKILRKMRETTAL